MYMSRSGDDDHYRFALKMVLIKCGQWCGDVRGVFVMRGARGGYGEELGWGWMDVG